MKRPALTMLTIVASMAALFAQNCSSKNFSPANGSSSSTGTPTTPAPNDPANQSIKMSLATPDCSPYSTCQATFTLKQAQSIEVRFHWVTDDTKYTSDPSRYAQPNVNYQPTEGDLIFVPGQTTKLIYIQSLAMTKTLKIPFRWNHCMGNGQSIVCPEVEYLNPQ